MCSTTFCMVQLARSTHTVSSLSSTDVLYGDTSLSVRHYQLSVLTALPAICTDVVQNTTISSDGVCARNSSTLHQKAARDWDFRGCAASEKDPERVHVVLHRPPGRTRTVETSLQIAASTYLLQTARVTLLQTKLRNVRYWPMLCCYGAELCFAATFLSCAMLL